MPLSSSSSFGRESPPDDGCAGASVGDVMVVAVGTDDVSDNGSSAPPTPRDDVRSLIGPVISDGCCSLGFFLPKKFMNQKWKVGKRFIRCHFRDDLRQRSDEIDEQLKKDRILARNEVTMLFLGSKGAGISTILKQMKLVHNGGYTANERTAFKHIVVSNMVQSMRDILEAKETLGISTPTQMILTRKVY
jgi:hypothetical protein